MGLIESLGRGLQLLALILLPLGMMLEISGGLGRRGVAEMLLILVFGILAFLTGQYLQGLARRT